jgi:hypothetical protein
MAGRQGFPATVIYNSLFFMEMRSVAPDLQDIVSVSVVPV